MRFRILVGSAAEEDYLELPPELRERAKQRIFALGTEPLPGNATQLSGDLRGLCRVRLGDYRIVYELNTRTETVRVIAIADRARVYDVVRRRWKP